VLGRHEGQHEFTVGQRRGIGVHSAEPLYVREKDAATNRVTVGPRHQLATTTIRLEAARFHRAADQVRQVRLRYHAEPIPCRAILEEDGQVRLELERSAHAVAPGQLACLMRDDCVVGEATIGKSG
jgi:tRNA-uridine 2-sulfurtransferase